jgi:hypothetical protein
VNAQVKEIEGLREVSDAIALQEPVFCGLDRDAPN